MRTDRHIVIVGAGVAGLNTAESLRQRGATGPITMLGAEVHAPYSRPPLSKKVLGGEWSDEQTTLATESRLRELRVHHRPGLAATGLDLARRQVLMGNDRVDFDVLVIATGVEARTLPAEQGGKSTYTLRTREDARELTKRLAGAKSVTIVGTGVLGFEIASSARKRGLTVTMIGRSRRLAVGPFGDVLDAQLRLLTQQRDVRLLLGREIDTIVPGERATQVVRLSDRTSVTSDVVIVAIGSAPAVGWLAGSGLDLLDGVLCDERGVAAADVFAVGDVACWRDPLTGRSTRNEFQSSAVDQADVVAATIMGQPTDSPDAPFFSSEILGRKVFGVGSFPPGGSLVVTAGDEDGQRFVARYDVDGTPAGLIGWDLPREFRQQRMALAQDLRKERIV